MGVASINSKRVIGFKIFIFYMYIVKWYQKRVIKKFGPEIKNIV
jgi:hypothetical protein